MYRPYDNVQTRMTVHITAGKQLAAVVSTSTSLSSGQARGSKESTHVSLAHAPHIVFAYWFDTLAPSNLIKQIQSRAIRLLTN